MNFPMPRIRTLRVLTNRPVFPDALKLAFQSFQRLYPQWTEYFFDEHFLANRAAPLLAGYQDGTTLPDPDALVEAWAWQLRWFDEKTRQETIAQLIPAVDHFLCLLEDALAELERSHVAGFQLDTLALGCAEHSLAGARA